MIIMCLVQSQDGAAYLEVYRDCSSPKAGVGNGKQEHVKIS
jgi:hypothetical protein